MQCNWRTHPQHSGRKQPKLGHNCFFCGNRLGAGGTSLSFPSLEDTEGNSSSASHGRNGMIPMVKVRYECGLEQIHLPLLHPPPPVIPAMMHATMQRLTHKAPGSIYTRRVLRICDRDSTSGLNRSGLAGLASIKNYTQDRRGTIVCRLYYSGLCCGSGSPIFLTPLYLTGVDLYIISFKTWVLEYMKGANPNNNPMIYNGYQYVAQRCVDKIKDIG